MPTFTIQRGDRNPDDFDAGDVEVALAAHGAKNVAVAADGTIHVEAKSDPTDTWNSYVPVAKAPPLTLAEIARAVVGPAATKAKLVARLAALGEG